MHTTRQTIDRCDSAHQSLLACLLLPSRRGQPNPRRGSIVREWQSASADHAYIFSIHSNIQFLFTSLLCQFTLHILWLNKGTLKLNTIHSFRLQYRMSLLQDFYGNDFLKRVNFCNLIRRKMCTHVSFLSHVLFSDEANFANTRNVNRHNIHY